MGFSVECPGWVVTHLMYRTALVVAVFRWVFYWAFNYMGLTEPTYEEAHHRSHTASLISAQMVRDNLHVATYDEIAWRVPESSGTCAICLNELKTLDKVRELRNCCHVFHKRCLDMWLDHDDHKTCPLCRAPLLGLGLGLPRPEPNWAVEQLVYLLGDDLLFSPS